MGLLEPEDETNCQMKIAIRLLALFPTSMMYWYHFAHSGIRINVETGPKDTIASNFTKLMLQMKDVDPLIVKTMDVSLILYAEHDFNASTFVARATVSTLSDFYSGITSGIGALRGPLHGGANEAVM